MDFHGLARKELQAICKKNKIPANITNVAMADALKTLDKVEGLDELINAAAPTSDPQQSPAKSTNAEPRTVCRTSTRRKPINVEPESSQALTRTRRTTRRTSAEEAGQENKNTNILETPAMPTSRRRVPAASARRKIDTQLLESEEDEKSACEEKSDVPPETPAIQPSTAVSTRRKMGVKKDEKSVQKAYGTRNSVRLLEKSLGDLSLKEERTVEDVKIEGLCEETKQVEHEKDVPGGDSDIDESLDNEDGMKYEVQQESKTTDQEVTENTKLEMCSSSQSCNNLDSHSGLDAEDKDDDNCSGESLVQQVDTSEKAMDLIAESMDENGPFAVITESSEIVNAALEPETEKELVENQDSLVEEVPKESSYVDIEKENISDVVITENSEIVTAALVPDIRKELIDNQDSLIEVSDDRSPVVMEKESISIVNASDDVSVEVVNILIPKASEVEGEVSVEVMDLSEVMGENSEMNLKGEHHGSHDMDSNGASDEDSDGSHDMDSNDDSDDDSDGNVTEEESDGCESDDSEEAVSADDEYNTSVPDAIEVNESAMIAKGSSSDSNCPVAESKIPTEEFAVPAQESNQALNKSPYKPLVSGEKVTEGMISSAFAANTIQGQLPRPVVSTPSKSSTKKETRIKKVMSADINKENIDTSGRKVEAKKDKAKIKVVDEDVSMRKLRKMLKEKLKLVNKNIEEKNVSKVETRTALQILPDNCIAATEPEQKN